VHIVFNSFLLVFASEMGDKTQLLALILAARFLKPWPIMAGILVATVLNHGVASILGGWMGGLVAAQYQAWIFATAFAVFAIWILVPDKDENLKIKDERGAFITTVITFFLAEMGDKTQLATLALGAKYDSPLLVTFGTTLGMLAADGLAVFLGHRFTNRIPMKWVRIFASALFFLFALYILSRAKSFTLAY